MEEEGWERVAGAGVYDYAAEPPAYTWWSDEEGVYLADGDGEGIVTY